MRFLILVTSWILLFLIHGLWFCFWMKLQVGYIAFWSACYYLNFGFICTWLFILFYLKCTWLPCNCVGSTHITLYSQELLELYGHVRELLYICTWAVCPQCYCREIWHMLTIFISLSCLKAYHRPDHSACIVDYRRRKLLSWTQERFSLQYNLQWTNLFERYSGFYPFFLYDYK
jgi:hypothetical protein